MPKRKCRMTTAELEMHDRAVKLRKMTDEQLCHFVDKGIEDAYKRGYSNGRVINAIAINSSKSIKHFLENLNIPGVDPATVDKLRKYAKDGGYIGME